MPPEKKKLSEPLAGTKGASSGLRSIVSNSGFLTAARLVTQFVRAVYILLIARLLGPDLYGIFAYGQSWYVVFLPLVAFGLGGIISREIGRERTNAAALLEKTLLLRLLTGVAVTLLAASIAWSVEERDFVRLLLLVFCLALLGRGLVMWAESVFIAYERTRNAFLQQTIFRPLEVIVGIGLILADFGLLGLAAWHAIVWWLNAVFSLGLVHRNFCRLRIGAGSLDVLPLIRSALPLMLNTFAANWLTQGPLVLYRYQPGVSDFQLGQLALPMQIIMVLAALPTAFSAASIPVLSRSAHRQDGKDTRFVAVVIRASLLGGGLVGLVALGAAAPVTRLFFGEAYGEAGRLLGYAAWLMIPITVGNVLVVTLIARNEGWWLPILGALASMCLVLILPGLSHALGPVGVLLAAGLSMTAWITGMSWRLNRLSPLDIKTSLFRPLLAVCIGVATHWVLADNGALIATVTALATMASSALMLSAISVSDFRTFRKLSSGRA